MALTRVGVLSIAVLLALVAASALATWRLTTSSDSVKTVDGVRLGMTPSEARMRFTYGRQGVFTAGAYGAGELALDWRAGAGQPAQTVPRSARFEFHGGVLAAIRLSTSVEGDANGAPLEITPGSVLARRFGPAGVTDVTLLSRDCPVHQREVSALLMAPSASSHAGATTQR